MNDVVTQFNSYTLFYYYWVDLILNNSDETKERANEIDQSIKTVLTEMLVQDLCTIAHYLYTLGNRCVYDKAWSILAQKSRQLILSQILQLPKLKFHFLYIRNRNVP